MGPVQEPGWLKDLTAHDVAALRKQNRVPLWPDAAAHRSKYQSNRPVAL